MPEIKKQGDTVPENGNPKNAAAFRSGGVPQPNTVIEFVNFFCNRDGENVGKMVYLGNKIHGMPVKLAALKKTDLDQDASDSTYLTEARKNAKEFRELIGNDIDPLENKKKQKQLQEESKKQKSGSGTRKLLPK